MAIARCTREPQGSNTPDGLKRPRTPRNADALRGADFISEKALFFFCCWAWIRLDAVSRQSFKIAKWTGRELERIAGIAAIRSVRFELNGPG